MQINWKEKMTGTRHVSRPAMIDATHEMYSESVHCLSARTPDAARPIVSHTPSMDKMMLASALDTPISCTAFS